MSISSAKKLQSIFRRCKLQPSEYFSCSLIDDNIYRWKLIIAGQSDTLYSGAFMPAELNFPEEFPNRPPSMRFLCPMYHPNIGSDGNVCISILHEPGQDEFEYESPKERWLPIQTVESIVISVVSLLDGTNPE